MLTSYALRKTQQKDITVILSQSVSNVGNGGEGESNDTWHILFILFFQIETLFLSI